jgi:predicted permease
MYNDLRYAIRQLRNNPGFTAVAILTLALGIGANTAIFSLVNTVMLRLLPVEHPEQLVEFLQTYPGYPRGGLGLSADSYEHFRANNHVFSDLTGTRFDNLTKVRIDGSESELVVCEFVAGNYFPLLGLKPEIGRLIAPDDNLSSLAGAVAVVSWSYWNARFHLNPATIGKRILIQDQPVTIVGVAPRAFFGVRVGYRTDVWVPRPKSEEMGFLLGRLRPGVSLGQAQAEMSVLYQSTLEETARTRKDPSVWQQRLELEPAGAGLAYLRDRYAKPLVLLMAVVGLLLMITCINLASMLLARAAGRQREMAVRVGLGASRLRLVQQVMTESLLLSAAGAFLGVGLAHVGTGILVQIIANGPEYERFDLQVQPDLRVLIFTAGIALLASLLSGLAPALYAFRSAPASALRQTGKSETRLGRLFGKALVAAQLALSILLLSAAGLFVGHLSHLKTLDLGFQRDHVLLVTLDPAAGGHKRERLSGPYQELLARLESIPGVRSASISAVTPIQGAGFGGHFVTVEGFQERPENRRRVSLNLVAPKYFETLGTPLLAGRDFRFDDEGRARVAIVNRAMARYFFGETDPIGKHVHFDDDIKPHEVVGVVGDAKYLEIRESPPLTLYANMFQEGQLFSQFALRTSVGPESIAGEVRRTVREFLSSVPITRVITLAEQIDASIIPERLIATLSGLFGALAWLIAAIGLSGLLAYTVARRTNEIGIRMALGATQSAIFRMVLGEAFRTTCLGLLIGTPIAYWGKQFATSLIPDLAVKSAFPIVFGVVMIIVLALLAAYVPARRAARVDPMVALRCE